MKRPRPLPPKKGNCAWKSLLGYSLILLGVGMILKCFLPNGCISFFVIIGLLFTGVWLLCH